MPMSTSWSSTMSAMDATMMRQPLHTMWWVNGPLKVNDTVPVLVFPTNVTGSTTVDVGGIIGSRSPWTLAFSNTRSLLPPDPLATMTASIPVADNFEFALTFNYDQTSDLLLNATADIHIGFGEETFIQPTACGSSATTPPATIVCPAGPIPILREFGINVRASLKLISTTLDLTQRLTPTVSWTQAAGQVLAAVQGLVRDPSLDQGRARDPAPALDQTPVLGAGITQGPAVQQPELGNQTVTLRNPNTQTNMPAYCHSSSASLASLLLPLLHPVYGPLDDE